MYTRFLGENLSKWDAIQRECALAIHIAWKWLERAQEEIVDDLLQVGNPDKRMRAMVDLGQPDVADVFRARATEGRDKLIRQNHIHLGVDLTVNK